MSNREGVRSGSRYGQGKAGARLVLPGAHRIVAADFFVVMICGTLPIPLYVLYQRALGFSVEMITVIFALFAVGNLAALLFLGRLSDHKGGGRILRSMLPEKRRYTGRPLARCPPKAGPFPATPGPNPAG